MWLIHFRARPQWRARLSPNRNKILGRRDVTIASKFGPSSCDHMAHRIFNTCCEVNPVQSGRFQSSSIRPRVIYVCVCRQAGEYRGSDGVIVTGADRSRPDSICTRPSEGTLLHAQTGASQLDRPGLPACSRWGRPPRIVFIPCTDPFRRLGR